MYFTIYFRIEVIQFVYFAGEGSLKVTNCLLKWPTQFSCNPAICWFTSATWHQSESQQKWLPWTLWCRHPLDVCRPCSHVDLAVLHLWSCGGREGFSLSNEMWPKWPPKEKWKSQIWNWSVLNFSTNVMLHAWPPKGLESEPPYHDNPMSRRLFSQSILLVKEVHLGGGGTHFTHCTYPPQNPPKHPHPVHGNAPDSVVTF